MTVFNVRNSCRLASGLDVEVSFLANMLGYFADYDEQEY